MTQFLSVQYQHADHNDLASLLLLEQQCHGKKRGYPKLMKHYIGSQISKCIVAKQDNELLGYVLIVFSPNLKTATITGLGVLPRFLGQGIGRNLLEWAEIDAMQTGASQIGLEALYESDALRHILDDNGYQETNDPLSLLPEHSDGAKFRKRLFADMDTLPLQHLSEVEFSSLHSDHLNINLR